MMVLLLVFDEPKNLLDHRLRNRICRITCLPSKLLRHQIVLIDEMRTASLDLLDHFCNRLLWTQQKQAMDMIGHAIYNSNRTTLLTQLVRYKLMNLTLHIRVNHERPQLGGPNGVYPYFIV
jgi:hypothetical protein